MTERIETLREESDKTDSRIRAVAQLARSLAPDRLSELSEFFRNSVPDQIPIRVAYEIILQSYLFFGYAQAIEAAKRFAALGFGAPDNPAEDQEKLTRTDLARRGRELCSRIYAPNFDQLVSNMRLVSPELADWMVVEGYGRVLSRGGPTELEREVASIVFLVCSGHPVQLYSHVRGARNLGMSRAELEDVLKKVDFDSKQRHLLDNTITKVFGA